ncbi:MAG: hypothetical protein ACK5L5_07200 [Bacteroidales bacterium]
MKIIDRIEHIKQIDQLIRLRCTGNLRELAKKTLLSRRQVRRYIEEMRDMGDDIYFDRHLSTYRYKELVKFYCGFMYLDPKEMQDIKGGFLFRGQKTATKRSTSYLMLRNGLMF